MPIFYEVNFRNGGGIYSAGGEESEIVEATSFVTTDTLTTFVSGGDVVLAILTASIVSIRRLEVELDQALRFVLTPAGDGPDHTFVEVETDTGSSVSLGHWEPHPSGDETLTTIRFTVRDMVEALARGNTPTA